MQAGRILILSGIALVVLGVVVSLAGRLPIRLGQLPGDIVLRGRNSTFYFPLATCLVVSVILSLVMWLFSRR